MEARRSEDVGSTEYSINTGPIIEKTPQRIVQFAEPMTKIEMWSCWSLLVFRIRFETNKLTGALLRKKPFDTESSLH